MRRATLLALLLSACSMPCPEHSSEVDAGGGYTCQCNTCWVPAPDGGVECVPAGHDWDQVCVKAMRP